MSRSSTTLHRVFGPCVAFALLVGTTPSIRSEVSIDPRGGNRFTAIVMGISEGPDPSSPAVWQVYRPIASEIFSTLAVRPAGTAVGTCGFP